MRIFKLSVVIPCKNEGERITLLLDDLIRQRWIRIVSIVVADSSTDETPKIIGEHVSKWGSESMKLEIVEGGLPSIARNRGYLCSPHTEFVLFIDADMRLKNDFLIHDLLQKMKDENLDLTSCRLKNYDSKYNWVYRLKDLSHLLTGWKSPFAVGGFMLFRGSKFRELGMFDEEVVYAEDYFLSKKVNPKKFSIPRWAFVYTSSRRFEKKSPLWMIKMAVLSFLNRGNRSFFQKDWSYWD